MVLAVPVNVGKARSRPAYSSGLSGGPGSSVRIELAEPRRHLVGDEPFDVAAERGDLLHPARRDERELRARHDVHRLDLGREPVVEAVHLELPLEVRDHAEPFHHRPGAVLAGEVDDELAEDVDDHVRHVRERVLEERDALLDGERRLLVVRIANDADDDRVEDRGRAADHVDVAQGDGVERAGVDCDDRAALGHGSLGCVKTESRAEPYRRVVTRSSGSSGSTRASVSTTTRPEAASTAGNDPATRRSSVCQRVVRRVEQDEVVVTTGDGLVADDRERVAVEDERTRDAECLEVRADHGAGGAVGLGEDAPPGAAGERLEPERAGARVEVEDGRVVDRADEVEERLAHAISCRPRVRPPGRRDPASPVCSRDDPHAGRGYNATAER